MTKNELTQKLNELAARRSMNVSADDISAVVSYLILTGALDVQPERATAAAFGDFVTARFGEVV